MIELFVFLFIGGAAALAFGIWEQKTKFGEQHFDEAEVVGHQNARTVGLAGNLANAAVGVVNPLVKLTFPDGITRTVRLHTQIPRSAFSKFPELDLGGRVSVTYFGSTPNEVFLTGHPLGSKPVRTSTALIIGCAVLATAVLLLIFWFANM